MKKIYLFLFVSFLSSCAVSQNHPRLIVADDDVQDLKAAIGHYPLWDATVNELAAVADEALAQDIDVPMPKDPAGGYTHEKHKANGVLLKDLGLQYQLSGDLKYAEYAKAMFLEYAAMYPSLKLHPVDKSYARGKLFWQQLNEAVFLCDAIQGYDCIYDVLTTKERQVIEDDFILPFADFISIETPYVFNKIHNHGVWAAAAVGMTGMVLDNEELVARAFYGLNAENKPMQAEIDGFGDSPYGFFTQTKELFSPDGYYTEGPYYQRYAMTPFLLFAQSINQNYPEMKVFDFNGQVYIKAVETLLHLTDDKGCFFPINDYMKGMGLTTPSMIWGLDFLYARTKNPQILSVAEEQGLRSISMGGMEIAKGLAQGKKEAIDMKSQIIADGADGKSGGIGVMRNKGLTTVFKFATQGMGHGHFDRLNIIHFNKKYEVISDYGSARFVNVEAKDGGRYLPENESFAMQTVAHNTLTVNEKSHFGGTFNKSVDYSHSDMLYADISNEDIQIIAAEEDNAFPTVGMKRIVAQVNHKDFSEPILLDVFVADGDSKNQYDLPYHFYGEIMSTDFDCQTETEGLKPLGTDNGYQHLWKIASGKTSASTASFTWMYAHKFYSLTSVVDDNTELIFTRTGANDPHLSLRVEPTFIIRQNDADQHIFTSVLECHGDNNPTTEVVSDQKKRVQDINVERLSKDVILVNIQSKLGGEISLLLSLTSEPIKQEFVVEGDTYLLDGNYKLITK